MNDFWFGMMSTRVIVSIVKLLKISFTSSIFCRSPGKIISVSVPTFEALTQFGLATITTKNTGEVEASYSLTVFWFSTFPSQFLHSLYIYLTSMLCFMESIFVIHFYLYLDNGMLILFNFHDNRLLKAKCIHESFKFRVCNS
jgi:hypothetical protein